MQWCPEPFKALSCRIFAGTRIGSRVVGLAQIVPFGEGLGGSGLGRLRRVTGQARGRAYGHFDGAGHGGCGAGGGRAPLDGCRGLADGVLAAGRAATAPSGPSCSALWWRRLPATSRESGTCRNRGLPLLANLARNALRICSPIGRSSPAFERSTAASRWRSPPSPRSAPGWCTGSTTRASRSLPSPSVL